MPAAICLLWEKGWTHFGRQPAVSTQAPQNHSWFSMRPMYFFVSTFSYLKYRPRELPGGPVVRMEHFDCWGPGSIPGWGAKNPHAVRWGQNKRNTDQVSHSTNPVALLWFRILFIPCSCAGTPTAFFQAFPSLVSLLLFSFHIPSPWQLISKSRLSKCWLGLWDAMILSLFLSRQSLLI